MQYSIVNYSKIKIDSNCLRIDSEFFKANFLKIEKLLKKDNSRTLKEFGVKIYHPNEIKRQYTESQDGKRFVRAQNVRPFFADLKNNPVFINKADAKKLSKNQIKNGDILITRTGANFGQCCIYLNNDKAIASSHTFICKSGDLETEFLMIFLNSKYGRELLNKGMYGGLQPEIAPFYIYNIPIPNFSKSFQKMISNYFGYSSNLRKSSKSLYAEAENLLLEELGLQDWKPTHQLTYIKHYSDTQKAGRVDAEYFQPMYDEVMNILFRHDIVPLEKISSLINYGTVPTSPYVAYGVPYIKGSNLVNGFIQGKIDKITNTNGLSVKFYLKKNDIIISQMGTVGNAAIATYKEEGYLFASFCIRTRLKDEKFINPYVLTMYINKVAKPYYILRRIAQASVRQNTDLPTIKNMPIPRINLKVQKQISSKIIESKEKAKQSKTLLEIAKKAVEVAIETNEDKAIEYIHQALKKANISLSI